MSLYVDEHVCIRTHDADCTRCKIACPVDAISFDEVTSTPRINKQACTQCGICMSVCDAFSTQLFSYEQLRTRVEKIALQGDIVYITCQKHVDKDCNLAPNAVVVPCLAFIPYEFFALMLAEHLPVCIACDFSVCQTCDIAPYKGELLLSSAITYAENITGTHIYYQKKLPDKNEDEVSFNYDRRSIFTNIGNEAREIFDGSKRLKQSQTFQQQTLVRHKQHIAQSIKLPSEHVVDVTYEGYARKIPHGRKMLLEACALLDTLQDSIHIKVSALAHHVPEKYHTEVSTIGAQACPYGARTLDAQQNPHYDYRYCRTCEACARATHNDIHIVFTTMREA
ncbi:MAG: hypothetical protein IJV62_04730, partial [Eggerthellaceae bacterium]|nr:hypothetical protein [Eggerthellaceae bacterium]